MLTWLKQKLFKDEQKEAIKYPPRGLWIWTLEDLPSNIVELCLKRKVGRVYLKIMDDASGGKLWNQANAISQFVSAGIQVFGWGYHFTGGKQPSAMNISNSINRAAAMGMTGYVFDLEVEMEGKPERTKLMLEVIRFVKKNVHKPLTLGFSSFGIPEYHPSFPWKELSAELDCEFRQTYFDLWKGEPLELIKQSLAKKFGKPIYPIFSCEKTTDKALLQKVIDMYEGCSLWRDGYPVASELNFHGEVKEQPKSKLFEFYSKESNYHKVEEGVREFYPPFRSNGCVAFMSEALRQCGYKVPIQPGLGGENISLVTKPFAFFLEKTLGFKLISNVFDLIPGDVVLTTDAPGYPTWPAHTYAFAGWADKTNGIGWVIDNQGFMHKRNILDEYGDYNFSPFQYALRPV